MDRYNKEISPFYGGYSNFCGGNGRYIGQAYPQDQEGRPMPEIRGSFLVPEEEFLPIGTNPRSFDGRYTGTVPLKNIKARVIPLITGTWMP